MSLKLKERNKDERDEIKGRWYCGGSQAAGRSHDFDPLYHAIISYSRRNGAQRRSWSSKGLFLPPRVNSTNITSSFSPQVLHLEQCLPFIYFSSPTLLTWNSNLFKVRLFSYRDLV